MRTPTPTCAAIWSDTSIMPFPKTPPITNTLWKARTTCPLTSNRQFSAARFRYRWDAAGYSSAPGRESISANIATTAARDGWWRLCTERGSRIEDRGSRIENRELKFTSKVIVLSSILDPRSSILLSLSFFLFQRPDHQMRAHPGRVVDPVSGFLKIGFGGVVDVDEFLRVAVYQREPTALNLNHDLVSRLERVMNIVQGDFDLG